jgi:hypothetical protein
VQKGLPIGSSNVRFKYSTPATPAVIGKTAQIGRISGCCLHLGIENPHLFPRRLILFDELQVARVLLVCVMIRQRLKHNVQSYVERTVVDRPGERVAQDTGAEVHLSRMTSKILPTGIDQPLSGLGRILMQSEVDVVDDLGRGLRHV